MTSSNKTELKIAIFIPAYNAATTLPLVLERIPPEIKQSVSSLFSTHPPLEARLKALAKLESQLQGQAA